MRSSVRPLVLLLVLLSGSACVATVATESAAAPSHDVPKQCPADFRWPDVEMPAGCEDEAIENGGMEACVSRQQIIDILTDPVPSLETKARWSRYLRIWYPHGINPETGRPKIASLRESIVPVAVDYFQQLPPPSEEELDALRDRVEANLVRIDGGQFQMGDFGPLVGNHGVFTGTPDDQLHWVTLSDYEILNHRVTFADYDLYTRAHNLQPIAVEDGSILEIRFKNFYVVDVTWQQAQDYCRWLGEVIDRPVDLPTEAQWEYAARAEGELLLIGSTIPREQFTGDIVKSYAECRSRRPGYSTPIGTFPPNELGMYGMVGYGKEWVRDWYGADYYASSGEMALNPTGPMTGEERVVREGTLVGLGSMTFTRESEPPEISTAGLGFRCAVKN